MEPLKEMFNSMYYLNLAAVLHKTHKRFDIKKFTEEVTNNLESLSLNQRLRNTSAVLRNHLPSDFNQAVRILIEAAPELKKGYTALVLPDFVGLYGRKEFDTSMNALKYFTSFGSSEFAIREFLKTDLKRTLKVMELWAEDDNYHVRRLASEGSRPRLPWSFHLQEIIKEPRHTAKILGKLKADPELYVRKSVANHLNDISKDHPEYMIDLVGTWNNDNPHTSWIIRHASRTLIKKGHEASFDLFRYEKNLRLRFQDFNVSPSAIKLGESILFWFTITSEKKTAQKLVIDYAVHYVKASGNLARKVFKLKEIVLEPLGSVRIAKKQVFKNFTTRIHYPGLHLVEILINGKSMGQKEFRMDTL